MDANVLCSDMSPGSLEHFAAVLTEVYIPLLSNVNNQVCVCAACVGRRVTVGCAGAACVA